MSPMKQLAGCRLTTRNPAAAPPTHTANAASSARPPLSAHTPMATSAIAAVDAASPSNPSVTFTALLSATAAKAESAQNHRPIGMDHPPTRYTVVGIGSCLDATSASHAQYATATAHCAANFFPGVNPASFRPPRSFPTSSTNPIPANASVAAVADHAVASAKPVNANAHAHPAGTNAAPPIVGVFVLTPWA